MNDEPVLTQIGSLLLEYFRGALVPAVLGEAEMIRLSAPDSDEDFRLGMCLYDLEELRLGGPGTMKRLSEEERGGELARRYPSLILSLHFIAFANRKAAFHSVGAEDELLLLEAAARTVHSAPGLPFGGGTLRLGLESMERDHRGALWQSMHAPLQPAIYFSVEPVCIPSTQIRRVPAVRTVDPSIQKRKEERK